jgi:two-component system, OmpR family, alkaline phosphatase synthesis response regulator PhoP
MTILVVEDERKTADTIRRYLEHAGYDVVVCADGAQGLNEAASRRCDLVVLDLALPALDGIEVCRALRESGRQVPIIMLTARTTEDDRLRGFDVGADDYVTKPFSPRELVRRVHAVLRRGQAPATPVLRHDGLSVNLETRQVFVEEREVPLTATEFRLLITLMKAPGRPFTRSELVEHVLNEDGEALERTIDAHIMNLRRKLESDRTSPQFVLTVFGVGYRFAHAVDAS